MMLNLYFCSICYVFSLSYEITIFNMKHDSYIKTALFYLKFRMVKLPREWRMIVLPEDHQEKALHINLMKITGFLVSKLQIIISQELPVVVLFLLSGEGPMHHFGVVGSLDGGKVHALEESLVYLLMNIMPL